MPDPFLGPIFERMAREQRAGLRIGTLTAIDVGDASVTVSLAGDEVPGMRWVGSYTPVIGDVVVVARVDASWVIIGYLSEQLGAPTVVYETATVTPTALWSGSSSGTWSWSLDADHIAMQGAYLTGGITTVQAGAFALPVSAALPSGATLLSAKIRVTRFYTILGAGSTLVFPHFWLHNYSAIPSGAPSWIGALWAPGRLAIDQTGTWDLPSAWITSLLAGTATGVGVSSSTLAELAAFGDIRIDLSYSVPA